MRLKHTVVPGRKVILVVIVLVAAGCSAQHRSPSVATKSDVAPPGPTSQVAGLPPLPPGKHAAIIADPNPIKVCDGSGLGVTTLALTIEPPIVRVDVRVDSPGGSQLATKAESGYVTTGKWVNDGMLFYLQDVTGGKSLTPDNTLAAVTARVTQEGCP